MWNRARSPSRIGIGFWRWILCLLSHNKRLKTARQRMPLAAGKTGIAEHALELGEGVCIALFGASEHHQAEGRRSRRGYAIVVRYELERHGAAARLHGGVY